MRPAQFSTVCWPERQADGTAACLLLHSSGPRCKNVGVEKPGGGGGAYTHTHNVAFTRQKVHCCQKTQGNRQREAGWKLSYFKLVKLSCGQSKGWIPLAKSKCTKGNWCSDPPDRYRTHAEQRKIESTKTWESTHTHTHVLIISWYLLGYWMYQSDHDQM